MKESIFKLFQHSGIYGLSNILSRTVTFFLLPLYLKYLSPSDFGILEISNTLFSLLIVFELLNIDSGLFKLFYDKTNNLSQNQKVGTVISFYVVYGSIVSVILILASSFISTILLGSNDFGYLINLVIISSFLQGIVQLYLAIYRMKEKALAYSLYNIFLTILMASLNILFVVTFQRSYEGVREASLISIFLVAVILIAANLDVKPSYNKEALRRVLRLSIPLAGSGLAGWVLTLVDRYMLRILLPSDIAFQQIGIYSLGVKYSTIMQLLIVTPFMMAWSTLMFSYQHEKNAKELFAQILNIFILVSMSAFVVISIFGKEIIMFLAKNPEYHSAYMIIPMMTLSKLSYGIYMVYTVGVTLVEKTKYMMYTDTITAVLNIALNYFLIIQYGFIGAAIACLISSFARVFILYYYSQREYKIPYNLIRNYFLIFAIYFATEAINLEISNIPIKIISCVGLTILIFLITPLPVFKLIRSKVRI